MAALVIRRHDRRGRFLKVVGVKLSKKADEVKAERKVRLIHNARGARFAPTESERAQLRSWRLRQN